MRPNIPEKVMASPVRVTSAGCDMDAALGISRLRGEGETLSWECGEQGREQEKMRTVGTQKSGAVMAETMGFTLRTKSNF